MSKNRTWHSGPPPHIGWWQASTFENEKLWRWWDGRRWSFAVPISASPGRAAELSAEKTSAKCILWTHYWPENARVPRIVPTMDTETFDVGDTVRITEAHIKKMKASNRSSATPGYPSDSFISKAREAAGIPGQVTHTFPPGHNYSVRFDLSPDISISLHMKESWFTRA